MDFGSTRKLKYVIGLCLLTVLDLQVAAKDNITVCGTKEEVVSIYGPNFNTPESREPYFIKIQRCIFLNRETIRWESEKYVHLWSVPIKREEVVIVVSDINNKTKFYKYVVYNDKACECKPQSNFSQHKNLSSHEISETEFNSKVSKNPENIRTCNKFSYCSKPQPRYLINLWGTESQPQDKYILYHECLPGCNTTKKSEKTFTNIKKPKEKRNVYDAQNCSLYVEKTGKAARLTNGRSSSHGSLEASDKKKPQNEMIIYIGSTKLLLGAFVLSIILLSILILDCNLWHRKKGILYNILCYRKYKAETNHRAERRQEITDV